MSNAIVLEVSMLLTSLNSRTKIGSKRISRSIDDYKVINHTLETGETYPDITIDTIFEISCEKPLFVRIEFEGDVGPQRVKVHNYFVFTPPTGEQTIISIENTSLSNNQIKLFSA
jgi:hypothetical protein